LYHQTKDILYVKEFLGHKKIENTLLYIQLSKARFKEINDDFTVKVAKTPEEIQQLLEVGFEYVVKKDGLMFFRNARAQTQENQLQNTSPLQRNNGVPQNQGHHSL